MNERRITCRRSSLSRKLSLNFVQAIATRSLLRKTESMTTRQYKRSRLRQLVLPVIAAGFLGYFGYHAFNGYFGVWAKERLDRQAAQLADQLASLQSERKSLEQRVSLLRPETIDRDMVDEMARRKLGVMKHDEVMIFLDGHGNRIAEEDSVR